MRANAYANAMATNTDMGATVHTDPHVNMRAAVAAVTAVSAAMAATMTTVAAAAMSLRFG